MGIGTGNPFLKKRVPRPFQKTLTVILAVNGEYHKKNIKNFLNHTEILFFDHAPFTARDQEKVF